MLHRGGGRGLKGGQIILPYRWGGVKLFYPIAEGGSNYLAYLATNDHPPTELLKKTNP